MEEDGHPSTSRHPDTEHGQNGDEDSEKSYSKCDFDEYSESSASQAPPSEANITPVKLERVRSFDGNISKDKKFKRRSLGRVAKQQHRVKQAMRRSIRRIDKVKRNQLSEITARKPSSVTLIKMHQCPRCGHLNRYRR